MATFFCGYQELASVRTKKALRYLMINKAKEDFITPKRFARFKDR